VPQRRPAYAFADDGKYDPSEPRVPAGSPDGGEWTSGGGREPTQDEKDAIKNYTQSWFYPQINGNLRKGIEPNELIKDNITKMDSFLNKSPKFKGTLYRGLQFQQKRDIKQYNELYKQITKGELIDRGFMSTTSDELVRSDFTREPFHTMKFEIEGKNAVDIHHLARDPGEKEVIFPRGTHFKVVSYEDRGDRIIHMLNVKLKEI